MAKIKLIENSLSIIPRENIEIHTKNLLIEQEGTAYYCKGVLKEVPITRYTKNENDRIYGKDLWDKVKRDKVFENSICLADHSEDDGSVKDICGIWKNFQILNDHAVADLYSVGELGQLLMDFVLNSGKAGFSTVGYGDLNEGNVVDPESYEYCRTDWVINPSQNVYATKENAVDDKKDEIPKDESLTPTNIIENSSVIKENKNNNNLNNSITNKIDNSDNNVENIITKQEVMYMDKIQEANFKNHVNVLIKEARRKDNIADGIDDLKSIEIPEEFTSIRNKVDTAVSEMQSKLQEQKSNAEKTLICKEKELSEVKTKYDTSCKSLEELKNRYTKAKVLLEKINKEKVSIKTVGTDKLIKERKDMVSDIKQFMEDRKNMRKDINALCNKLREAETRIKTYEKELRELGYVFEDVSTPPPAPVDDETMKDPEELAAMEAVEGEDEITMNAEDDLEEENWDLQKGAKINPTDAVGIEINEEDEENGEEIVSGDDDEIPVEEENWDANVGEIPPSNTEQGIQKMGEEDWDLQPGQEPENTPSVVRTVEDDENGTGEEIVNDDEPYELPEEDGDNDDMLLQKPEDETVVAEQEGDDESDEMYMGGDDDEETINEEEGDEEIEDEEEDEEPVEEEVNTDTIRGGIFQGTDTKTLGEKKVMQKKVVKKGNINKESIAQNIKKRMLIEELTKFADSEIKKNSAVKDIKKHILLSKSFAEAVDKVRKFKNSKIKKDSPVRINESTTNSLKPDNTWLGGRR